MTIARVACLLAAWAAAAASPAISEDELRANLSFLASDALEGRATPSQGQAVAAEFIASRFRLARLQPAANDGFCQQAEFLQLTPAASGAVTVTGHGEKWQVARDRFFLSGAAAVHLDRVPLLRIQSGENPPADAAKRALLIEATMPVEQRAKLMSAKAALLVTVYAGEPTVPKGAFITNLDESAQPVTPRLSVWGDAGRRLLQTGDGELSVHVAAPAMARIRACNVAGVLPGSDPALKNEYVLVSAHYDHLAMAASGTDRIFNGANDDGSGTVSVIEIARALSAMPVKPRRSILFVTFTGEELGLLGSRYYARHPLVPLDHTVAQINLEQLGRTNAQEGFDAGAMTFTGFDFTDLPHAFEAVSAAAGVRVFSTKDSDAYFARSDNQPLADVGIPSSTVAVAYTFPEYHGVADEWQKIDFPNMAKVDRAIAAGIAAVADSATPPKWNSSDARTQRYREAYLRLHPAEPAH